MKSKSMKPKKVWREVFSAEPGTADYKMLHYYPQGFVEFALRAGASAALQDIVIAVENGSARRYEPVDQVDSFITDVFEKIIKNPAWATNLHRQCERFGTELLTYGTHLQRLDVTRLSTKELIDIHKKLVDLQVHTHLISNSVARADAYDQRFSTYLLQRVRHESRLSESEVATLFVHLTTPHQLSSVLPAVDFNANTVADVSFTHETVALLEVARDLVWTKNFRKRVLYFACDILDRIHTECARRLDAELTQINFMIPAELYAALAYKKYDPALLEARKKCSVLFFEDGAFGILSGEAAQVYLEHMNYEKKRPAALRGQCSYPGLVEATVKIIRSVADMGKINEGDVMAVHTTFPDYTPGISKAAALLSESGGLTCHAAIIARELQKPTIVGIAYLLDQIQDGDRLRVDATGGTVEILSTS